MVCDAQSFLSQTLLVSRVRGGGSELAADVDHWSWYSTHAKSKAVTTKERRTYARRTGSSMKKSNVRFAFVDFQQGTNYELINHCSVLGNPHKSVSILGLNVNVNVNVNVNSGWSPHPSTVGGLAKPEE